MTDTPADIDLAIASIPPEVAKAALEAFDVQKAEQEFRGFRSRDLLFRAAIFGAAEASRQLAGGEALGTAVTSTSTLQAFYRTLDALPDQVVEMAIASHDAYQASHGIRSPEAREKLFAALVVGAVAGSHYLAGVQEPEPEDTGPTMGR